MDIGARLKEARIAKGLSLDSLQETTKIQKRYLIAIEEGNFHILPGKFYARAFIKEYANAVGLDPNELIEEHKEEVPKTEEEEEQQKIEFSRMKRSRRESKGRSSAFKKYLPSIAAVVAGIGVLFAAWIFVQQFLAGNNAQPESEGEEPSEVIINQPDDEEGESSNAETESAEEEDNDESDSEMEGEAEITVVEVGSGQSPESTLELANISDELIILLETDDATWLDISDDSGEVIYSGTFSSENSPEEIDASEAEQLHFNIGNASALTITINGSEVEYPANEVHQKLTFNIN